MLKVESGPYISLSKIIRSPEPLKELENELVAMLTVQLKRFGVSWNPKAFRAGLNNPELPQELLGKLDDFLGTADRLGWALPKFLVEELDELVEDIESFNPLFLKSLEASRKSGRVSAEAVKKRLGL